MDWRLAGVLIRLGLPVALQNAAIALGVVIMQGKINSLGASSMAAYTAGSRIDTVMHQPVDVLASGLGVFAAQNFGAKRLDRIRSATRKAVWITIPITLGCMAVCWLFGSTLAGLFLDTEAQAAIHEAESYLRAVSPFFLPLGIMSVLRASLQAMGDTATPSAAAFAELGVKLLLMFTVFSDWGLTGVVLSSAITWALDLLIIAAAYLLRLRKVQRMLEALCTEQEAADFSGAEQPAGISGRPAAKVSAGSDEPE